ncbi:hypothetical protein EDB83DRAFT_2313742 [Lactarius deliciosus]|nr:hypothetical protein EDB83DRAFT_2313742 [Lactarius deliciosus]
MSHVTRALSPEGTSNPPVPRPLSPMSPEELNAPLSPDELDALHDALQSVLDTPLTTDELGALQDAIDSVLHGLAAPTAPASPVPSRPSSTIMPPPCPTSLPYRERVVFFGENIVKSRPPSPSSTPLTYESRSSTEFATLDVFSRPRLQDWYPLPQSMYPSPLCPGSCCPSKTPQVPSLPRRKKGYHLGDKKPRSASRSLPIGDIVKRAKDQALHASEDEDVPRVKTSVRPQQEGMSTKYPRAEYWAIHASEDEDVPRVKTSVRPQQEGMSTKYPRAEYWAIHTSKDEDVPRVKTSVRPQQEGMRIHPRAKYWAIHTSKDEDDPRVKTSIRPQQEGMSIK